MDVHPKQQPAERLAVQMAPMMLAHVPTLALPQIDLLPVTMLKLLMDELSVPASSELQMA
jgi:hypothetical protein